SRTAWRCWRCWALPPRPGAGRGAKSQRPSRRRSIASSTRASKMSSETSIKEGSPTLPSWQLFALAGLVGATLVVFVSRGQSPAAIILLSVVIFAAAAVGAAALRTLLPFVRGHEALAVQIVGGRARAAIEREKTLVLRSIKE